MSDIWVTPSSSLLTSTNVSRHKVTSSIEEEFLSVPKKKKKKHSCRWIELIPVRTTRGLQRDKGYGSVTLRCYGCWRSKYHTASSNRRFHPSSSTRQYAVIDRLLSAGHAFTRTAEQALRRNLPLTGKRVPSRQQGFFFSCQVVRNMWLQGAWLKTKHWKHFGTGRTRMQTPDCLYSSKSHVFPHVTKSWFMFVKVSYNGEIISVSLCTNLFLWT